MVRPPFPPPDSPKLHPPYFLVGHRPMLHAHIADDEMEGHFISALDWNSTFSCVCLQGIYSTSFCFLLLLLPAEVKKRIVDAKGTNQLPSHFISPNFQPTNWRMCIDETRSF